MKRIVALASLVLIGACGRDEVVRSSGPAVPPPFQTTDNPNAALPGPRPVALSAPAAPASPGPSVEPGLARTFEQALTDRLAVPSADCISGPVGSTPIDPTMKELLAKACSNKRDLQSERSARVWRAAALAAAPPLRAVPTVAPTVMPSDKQIFQVRFARTAPIAVLEVEREFRVVDAASGEILLSEPIAPRVAVGAPSANGRLFLYARDGIVWLRSTVTGELLLEIKDAEAPFSVFWMDPDALFYTTGAQGRVLDLRTNQQFDILTNGATQSRSIPVPTKQPGQREHLVLGPTSIQRVVLAATEDDRNAPKVVREHAIDRRTWSGWDGLSLDGRYFADGAPFLAIFDLEAFQIEQLSFAPFAQEAFYPSLEPNEWIVALYPAGRVDERRFYLFNNQQKTLAVVDAKALLATHFFIARVFNRLAIVTPNGLQYLDRVPHGEAVPFEVMAARVAAR